jgi:multisubunit Na+/H+ antiporter MnhF subunit
MGRDHNLYRIFIGYVLAMIVISFLISIFSDGCSQWLICAASILALYRVVRGADH